MCNRFYKNTLILKEDDFDDESSMLESIPDDEDNTEEQYRQYMEQQEAEEKEYRNFCYEMDLLDARFYETEEE